MKQKITKQTREIRTIFIWVKKPPYEVGNMFSQNVATSYHRSTLASDVLSIYSSSTTALFFFFFFRSVGREAQREAGMLRKREMHHACLSEGRWSLEKELYDIPHHFFFFEENKRAIYVCMYPINNTMGLTMQHTYWNTRNENNPTRLGKPL